jgi:hypothetical protein
MEKGSGVLKNQNQNSSNVPPGSERSSDTLAKKSLTRGSAYWKIGAVRAREAVSHLAPLDPVCPACHGLGVVKDVEMASNEYPFGQMINCPTCTKDQRAAWLRDNCGLSDGLLRARQGEWGLGTWAVEERAEQTNQRRYALKMVKEAVDLRKGLYTFHGDFGSGKTHALAVVVNECRFAGVESYYVTIPQVLHHLRSLIGQNLDGSTYWQRLFDVPVLALDEVTRINATEWALDQLFLLIDTRHQRRASHLTLFATNDDPRVKRDAGDTLGYLTSRMREGRLVELRGDMRAAAAGTPGWLT